MERFRKKKVRENGEIL
jgi:hypothetical protein